MPNGNGLIEHISRELTFGCRQNLADKLHPCHCVGQLSMTISEAATEPSCCTTHQKRNSIQFDSIRFVSIRFDSIRCNSMQSSSDNFTINNSHHFSAYLNQFGYASFHRYKKST